MKEIISRLRRRFWEIWQVGRQRGPLKPFLIRGIQPFCLRIAPELPLETPGRGWFNRVYEIGR